MSENIKDKFKDMDYETAISKLTELIGKLERGDGTFDEMLLIYKEAFEYYTYCSEYLNTASDKIKDLNLRMAGLMPADKENK